MLNLEILLIFFSSRITCPDKLNTLIEVLEILPYLILHHPWWGLGIV